MGPFDVVKMSEESRRAAEEWRQADAAQKEAEALLKGAWDTFLSKQARAPSAELIAYVSGLRRVAEEKLQEAIRWAHPEASPPQRG